MLDVVFVLAVVAFFALASSLVTACEKIVATGQAPPDARSATTDAPAPETAEAA
ncbi:MAG: hypothetical protein HYX34_15540 [Actinobacteria bacterium]|nr:hypothetical protein [Actinomycetota bacterium]